MTRGEILEHISRSLAQMFELDPDEVRPEANLYEDLDLDSIDAVDMAVKIQEITGKRVDEKSLRSARTVDDVVDLIVALRGEESGR